MECQTIKRYDSQMNAIFKQKRKFDTLDLAIKCHQYHIGRRSKRKG